MLSLISTSCLYILCLLVLSPYSTKNNYLNKIEFLLKSEVCAYDGFFEIGKRILYTNKYIGSWFHVPRKEVRPSYRSMCLSVCMWLRSVGKTTEIVIRPVLLTWPRLISRFSLAHSLSRPHWVETEEKRGAVVFFILFFLGTWIRIK